MKVQKMQIIELMILLVNLPKKRLTFDIQYFYLPSLSFSICENHWFLYSNSDHLLIWLTGSMSLEAQLFSMRMRKVILRFLNCNLHPIQSQWLHSDE